MRTRSTTVTPGDFSRVRRQFEQWRSKRRHGARIPERLWRAAVEVAREHGVSKTSQALRLDYYSLKERVEAVPRQRPDGRFVEIPLSAVPGGSPGRACVVEIEDGCGARLRMELGGIGAEELAGLVRSVWPGDR